jgi:hypothetical protein
MKFDPAHSAFALVMTALTVTCASRAESPHPKTENILFVTTDGLRWQEVFGGADDALMNKPRGGVQKVEQLRKQYWRDTPEARREALLPFTWSVIAKQGQLYGNRWKGSSARVTNGLNFSYPGYSELLCGFVDPRVESNEKRKNLSVSVLEWLHSKDQFKGRIAAFSSWDVFPYVLNAERSGLPINSGNEPLTGLRNTPQLQLLNALISEVPMVGEETRNDALTYQAARQYLLAKKPRVLYVAFDQTDEQGHAGRYDRVLGCARKVDGFVKDLWETMQGMSEYRGKTSLVFTTDHGRGEPPVDWKTHGKRTQGSEAIWMAFMGPDTPPLGERKDVPEVTQDRIAATLAALLGENYCAAVPKAGKPIDDACGRNVGQASLGR